jgi:hypothetical protein
MAIKENKRYLYSWEYGKEFMRVFRTHYPNTKIEIKEGMDSEHRKCYVITCADELDLEEFVFAIRDGYIKVAA